MKHELKIWPVFFERIADGTKTFEVRKNDRHFQCGDEVYLKEYIPDTKDPSVGRYTTKYLHFKIGFVYPIDSENVVFSLLPIGKKK
jgi:ASC-1-like (ASCH) protein